MNDEQISFRCESPGRDLDDVAFLTQINWLTSANGDIRQAAASENVEKFWRGWTKSLTARADRKLRRKRLANRSGLWPWGDLREHPARTSWSFFEKADWAKLSRWASQRLADVDAWQREETAWELLALAEWLLGGESIDATLALPIWRLALTWAIELSGHRDEPEGCQLSPDRRLLLCGELPWVLGQLFADVAGVTEFKQLGQKTLRNELVEQTDGDGTPAASLLPHLPRWLSSLTRSVEVGVIFGEPLLEGEARLRFEDVVTKAVMLLDRDGRMLSGRPLSPRAGAGSAVAMLRRAAELAGLNELSLAAESLRFREHVAQHGSGSKFRSETFAETPEERLIVTDTDLPAIQSDWAGWACLRNWWHSTANTAIVLHDGPSVRLQLCLLGVPVIEGEWGMNVRLDGQPLTWTDSWKCICWNSDTDMDYLELQLEWPDGPMLCRQVMLSRKDHFLVLADSVSRVGSRRIDLESTLPLRRGTRVKSDRATRELRLIGGEVKARCFPLALPEDRLHSTVGRFEVDSDALRLIQASSGEALYAPVIFDWSPQRSVLEAEWRPLTVTEDRRKLAPWEAAAHRLRLGRLHLVLYRSLDGSPESRAVLGLHTDNESVIGQFNDKGYVLPIVSVEA